MGVPPSFFGRGSGLQWGSRRFRGRVGQYPYNRTYVRYASFGGCCARVGCAVGGRVWLNTQGRALRCALKGDAVRVRSRVGAVRVLCCAVCCAQGCDAVRCA